MLDFLFISTENETRTFPVTEFEYKNFISLGIDKAGVYFDKNFLIEGDEYQIEVIELDEVNRKKFIDLINNFIFDYIDEVYTQSKISTSHALDPTYLSKSLEVMHKITLFRREIENRSNAWLSINP